MTIFTVWFQNFPNNFVILLVAAAIAGGFVFVFAKAAMVAEGGRQPLARKMTAPNTKLLFAALMVVLGDRVRDRPAARPARGRRARRTAASA